MTAALPARSARKREAIMSAGRELFLSKGYRGTSVDEIAALAVVSKQTVYKHFGDKRELLEAIVSAAMNTAVQPFVQRIAALADSDDVHRDLATLAADYLRSVLAEPVVQLRRLVIGQANALPELALTYYRQAPAQTLQALATAFGKLDERGLLSISDGDSAAIHFASLAVGHWIDRALFFGGPATLEGLDVEGHARAVADAFLVIYQRRHR
ncbi:TetR/AcrR family transcriptional regulator [Mycobacterium sp. NPDC050041]|uniref:TetR/AcrR family transcriptional regulator n=1 Tax=Mycobacterium sp. NPDC050041 TaxID=3364293 RepID=UPI003C2B3223